MGRLQTLEALNVPTAIPTRRSPSQHPTAAFTLIEILLAVAIFSVVLIAIHSVFHVALRLRNRSVQSIEAARPLQETLSILRRDLAGIVPPGGTFAGPLETTPITQGVGLSGTPIIQFHTAVGVLSEDSPWGDILRVAYLLAAPTNSESQGMDLVRSVTRNLLPVSQEDVESQRLMGGVESLTFFFHDGAAWQAVWDSTNEVTLLPRAIKAQIQLVVLRDTIAPVRTEPIELVVGLLVQPASPNEDESSTNAASPPSGGRP